MGHPPEDNRTIALSEKAIFSMSQRAIEFLRKPLFLFESKGRWLTLRLKYGIDAILESGVKLLSQGFGGGGEALTQQFNL